MTIGMITNGGLTLQNQISATNFTASVSAHGIPQRKFNPVSHG